MIDKDLIEAKFDIIERNLHFIRSYYEGKTAEEIEEDYRDYQALKFSLFEIVEACIDIANHIIAAERFERAEEYSQMFIVLGKNNVISEKLAEKLSNMARFRNLLVHRYGEIKAQRLMEIVKEDLNDIVEFVKEVKEFMEE